MPKTLFVCITTALFIFITSKSAAQYAKKDSIKNTNLTVPKSYWATLGLGGGTVGITAAATANAQLGGHSMVSASAQTEQNVQSYYYGVPSGKFAEVNNYNLLLGGLFKQRVSFISVSTGLGIVHSISYIDSVYVASRTTDIIYTITKYGSTKINQNARYALNIPLLVQGYIVVAEPVGFGFNAYLNLNSVRTTAGLTVNIALGRMTGRDGKTMSSGHPPAA